MALASTLRISLPTYCIWRRKPSWLFVRRASWTAWARSSGIGTRASCWAGSFTSRSPSACSACICCFLRVLLMGASSADGVASGAVSGASVWRLPWFMSARVEDGWSSAI